MRVVFFGTPGFAVPTLRALLREGHDVVGVVTQPDRAQGRSRSRLLPPPVKVVAETEGLEVHQPERPVGDLFLRTLEHLRPDIGVVVAYGHILTPAVLGVPRLGMVNVHASLLPHLRGAAPIQRAILEGLPVTGVSIMQMEEGLDSGPVYLAADTPIGPGEPAGALTDRLADLGAEALLDALEALEHGRARAVPQAHERATFAPKVGREDARLRWGDPATVSSRRVRAFDPEPGAWALLEGHEVKLFGARALDGSMEVATAPHGLVLEAGDTLRIATPDGILEVGEVQPAGKRRMPVEAWVRGRGVQTGQRFA